MSVVRVEQSGDVATVIVDNPPVNATSTAVRQGLMDAVQAVQGSRIAFLKCAGRTFIAGGDMSEFDRPAEEPHLPDVVDAIEASETPFVALLHGNVLGGGLEIAMACAWRIAKPGTKFGLPEVNVGLIPGAGGTQRAPRLFGWEVAADLACSGRMITAEEALKLGAIDAIEADFDALAFDLSGMRPEPVSKRPAPSLEAEWLPEKRITIQSRAKGLMAPLHNLDALQWAALPYEQGQPKERELHLKLRQSNESKALRHAFFAERAVSRPAAIEGGTAKDLNSIAIVGGGLMGAGIAAACLGAGAKVTIIELDTTAAEAAQERVVGILRGALKRGKITSEKLSAQLAAFSSRAGYEAASGADLAIEAVFEDLQVKKSVFADLAKVVRPDTILATNTSYLDPRDIFDGISHPERTIGLHFFSPAHIMRLLEIIHLPGTSKDTLATGFALAKSLRKVGVLSGICDGFIGNRMLAAYRRAAEYMLADGALPKDIDDAMKSFGMAMGPFEAQDMGGLQIAEANRRRQDATRDPNERYVSISDRLCQTGRLGQRSGAGWYDYKEGDRKAYPSPMVEEVILSYSQDHGISRSPYSVESIQLQLLAALANEGALIVQEGIAESDEAVDMVKLHGYGFPRSKGGPMFAAGFLGKDTIKSALTALETASPNSWVRAEIYR